MNSTSRRTFLKNASIATSALAISGFPSIGAEGANKKLVGAVIGTNGRGVSHLNSLSSIKNVEIAYICDVDDRSLKRGLGAFEKNKTKAPKTVKDLRQVLEDKSIDLITIATPNHWHAPATILGCSAGKHVYVEKPGSHNPNEGVLMTAAARKYNRIVQMGNQRRSRPWVIEAIEKIKAGEIGEVKFARTWYNNGRQSIGKGKEVPVPDGLDFSLWQGPAPERPYKDNLVHYNWHWRWHWGGGELANNGVHALDLVRWGMGVDLPTRVTCGGGKYFMPKDDDQETPDVYVVSYDFDGGKGATWEGHSTHPRGFEGTGFGVNFYGTKGNLVMAGANYKIYDMNGKQLSEVAGKDSDVPHFENFMDAIRNGTKLNAEIEDGQKSTLLCHLGNIAYRTGRTVNFDPTKRQIVDDADATKLWSREYRKGWEPKV